MATSHFCDVCGDTLEGKRPYDDWTSQVVCFQGEEVIVRMVVSTNNTDHDICESCARGVLLKVLNDRLSDAALEQKINAANY